MKIALIVEYEGTRYHGFQIQTREPTIQGELERVLMVVTGEEIRISYAGRTDQGVHARGQVVAFQTDSSLPPHTIARALNHYLPEDIAVRDAFSVDNDFDPRRDALSREYCYYIWNSATSSPLMRRTSYFIPKTLEIEAMNEACQAIIGTHDFAPFATSLSGRKNTVRTVYRAMVDREGDLVSCHVQANSFLTHQVRRTMGSLVKVGVGKSKVTDFKEILWSKEPAIAGPTLPAHGLCLLNVNYPGGLQ